MDIKPLEIIDWVKKEKSWDRVLGPSDTNWQAEEKALNFHLKKLEEQQIKPNKNRK